jgi:hypothetical protein
MMSTNTKIIAAVGFFISVREERAKVAAASINEPLTRQSAGTSVAPVAS